MRVLYNQIAQILSPGMFIPQPLELLFSWIESNGFFLDKGNQRHGFLFSQEQLEEEWTETERPGGTEISFFAERNFDITCLLSPDRADEKERLCVFAKTGADGSQAAFWLDENGNQKIVHIGSGSGSMLSCVLADEPIDFLRLLAIGYDEICRNHEYSVAPNTYCSDEDVFVHPNKVYQEWVKNTFSVVIPKTALEIVKHPSEFGDTDSLDPFCQWLGRNDA